MDDKQRLLQDATHWRVFCEELEQLELGKETLVSHKGKMYGVYLANPEDVERIVSG